MQEKELAVTGGSLYYRIENGKATITRFQGNAVQVRLPERIEGAAVACIGKKAFLSRKDLRRVFLPDSMEEIGDWAFAYCGGLREVVLPCREIRFGRAVFMECGSLERLAGTRAPGELLAAAVIALDAYYLLDLQAAGGGEWLAKWDNRLMAVMQTPETEGYSRQVLCGEEDYGSTDLAAYISGRRKQKIRLAFLRLLYPEALSRDNRAVLEGYLRGYAKGSAAGEEAWRVVLEEHGNDRAYYSLFAELGCITEESFVGSLADIGEEYPEMKAFFLRYKDEKLGVKDFFEDLEL